MDDDRGKPRRMEIKNKKNLLTRQRKGSVKALFLFFGVGGFSVDLRCGANLRVRRSVWSRRTRSKPGRLHLLLTAAATQIHGAQPLGSNKKSGMLRLQWETVQKAKSNSSLQSCLHWPRSITPSESSSCNLRPIPIVDYFNPFVTTATTSLWARKHGNSSWI